jgi:plasmid stabilization system protein ParE
MRIEFSEKALDHLKRIIDSHLDYSGERSALKFSSQLDERLNLLLRFPELGHPEPFDAGARPQN